MKILSLGAGMQSTALALMACENSHAPASHPLVPVYDAVVYCDLGFEAPWVQAQVSFIQNACKDSGIPLHVLDCNLYQDYLQNFGRSRTSAIPFRTLSPEGRKGKMFRACSWITRSGASAVLSAGSCWVIARASACARRT